MPNFRTICFSGPLNPQANFNSMFDKGEKLACINDEFSPTVRQLRAQFPKNNYIDTRPDISGAGRMSQPAPGGKIRPQFSFLPRTFKTHATPTRASDVIARQR